MKRAWIGAGLVGLYLLHNDLWWWDDGRLVLGLPIGLTYHIGFCLVVSAWMALAVRWAPPPALRTEDRGPSATEPAERET